MPTPTAPWSATPTDGAESDEPVAHHFDTLQQQQEAVTLGMWVFLATEIMFFGGAFATYTVYRREHEAAFHAASRELDLVLGGVNTLVLLTSSLTMAFAVAAAGARKKGLTVLMLLATMVLGTAFLGIKGIEYHHKYEHHLLPAFGLPFEWPEPAQAGGAKLFFSLYLGMTGLHALHMVIGIALMGIFAVRVWRSADVGHRRQGTEVLGLYWHFVDVVWIYLFPLLYLIDRS